jgi:hypothetical protein
MPLNIDEVLERAEEMGLDPRQTKNGFCCRCPVHGDTHNRHLYFHPGDKQGVVGFCHHGCGWQDIAKAMHLDWRDGQNRQPEGQDAQLTTYDWRDERGKLLYQTCRFKGKDGKKGIFYRRPNGQGEWIKDLQGVRLVLYRLPELLRSNPNRMVLWAEGEKCAELLARTGYAATTTAMGAKNSHLTEYVPAMMGRRVVIFPDYDEEGLQYAETIHGRLKAAGIPCVITHIPGLKATKEHGDDIADWVERDGHSLEEVIDLAEAALAPRPSEIYQPVEEEPPDIAPEAFWGIAGEFVAKIAPETESGIAAMLVNFLVAMGAMIGRSPHCYVTATRHGVNLFAAIVGTTGSGKGGAWDPVKWLINTLDDQFLKTHVQHGLSSGEGFVWMVRDPITKKVTTKPKKGQLYEEVLEEVVDYGVDDKRLLIMDTEFGGLLTVMSRAGNTLTTHLRLAWDGTDLNVGTKNNPLHATQPHIACLVQCTPADLRQHLTENQAANGFGNRFIWTHTKKEQSLPHGGVMPNLSAFTLRLHTIIEEAQRVGRMERTPEANRLWEYVYEDLSAERHGLVGAATIRGAPITLRLSMIYALLDGESVVGVNHLLAALAVWDYCLESATLIFGQRTGFDIADHILQLAEDFPAGVTKTQIQEKLNKNAPRIQMQMAIQELVAQGKIRIERKVADSGRLIDYFIHVPPAERIVGDFTPRCLEAIRKGLLKSELPVQEWREINEPPEKTELQGGEGSEGS